MANHHKIINGPSKWDLMLALFERQVVEFEIAGRVKVSVGIQALFNEYGWGTITVDDFLEDSGPDDSDWLITGELGNPEDNTPEPLRENSPLAEEYIVYIAYSSVKREGILQCVERSGIGYEEHLRFELIDRIWGDQSWRTKEV